MDLEQSVSNEIMTVGELSCITEDILTSNNSQHEEKEAHESKTAFSSSLASTNGKNPSDRKIKRKRKREENLTKSDDKREHRIRIPASCASQLFQLTNKLGKKWHGETIQWLFTLSEGAVKAAMNGSASPALPSTDMDSVVCKQPGFCDLPTDSIFLQQLGNRELRFVSKDKHLLTEEGRDRRIRLPRECALKLYPLTRKLGYKWDGETVEWLFKQSYHAIKALMSDDNKEDSSKMDISAQCFNNINPSNQSYYNYLSRNAFGSSQSQLQEQQIWSSVLPAAANHMLQGFPPLSTNYGNYDHLSYNSRGSYKLPQHDLWQLLAQQQAQYILMMDNTDKNLKSSKTRSDCIQ